MSYVSVDELLAVLGPGADPARAQLAADSVTAWIEARTGRAWGVAPAPLAPGPAPRAAVEVFEYLWSTVTAPPPSSGQLRADNATQALAAVLWISGSTVTDVAVGRILALADTGARVDVQDKDDSTKYQQWQLTGPAVDHTTYLDLPVAWIHGGDPIVAQRVMVTLLLQDGGGDTGDVPARIHQLALNGALRFYHDPEAPYGVIAATSDVPMYMRSLMTDADALLLGLREDFGLG